MKYINPDETTARATATLLRLALPPYTIHFKSPAYLQPHTLDLLDKRVSKEVLRASSTEHEVREAIGGDARYWAAMLEVVKAGVGSLEGRSFGTACSAGGVEAQQGVDYESSSGNRIASHYPSLWRDLERLNDLISIARNVLTLGSVAQNLAAEYGIDVVIFLLVNCCVRVTARGYDGDAGTGEEERWQWIVNAYKKLLITCLQFLNNFVAGNEARKLWLWFQLFDAPGESGNGHTNAEKGLPALTEADLTEEEMRQDAEALARAERERDEGGYVPPVPTRPEVPVTSQDILLAYGTNGSSRISPYESEGAVPIRTLPAYKGQENPSSTSTTATTATEESKPNTTFRPLPPQILTLLKKNHYPPNAYVYYTARTTPTLRALFQRDYNRPPSLGEIHRNLALLYEHERQALGKSEKKMWELWQGSYDRACMDFEVELGRFERGEVSREAERREVERGRWLEAEGKRRADRERKRGVKAKAGGLWEVGVRVLGLEEELNARLRIERFGEDADGGIGGEEDVVRERDDRCMLFTAEAGRKILESGKSELLKRLEGYAEEDAAVAAAHAAAARFIPSDAGGEARPEDIVAVRGGRRVGRRGRRSLSEAFAGQDDHLDDRDALAEGRTGDVDDRDQLVEGESDDLSEHGEDDEEDEEDDDEEEDDEEEDYPGSSEDGRGLLTDVPLILGPSEIEVLPMLVMSSIISSTQGRDSILSLSNPKLAASKPDVAERITDISALTTHLLLSRTSGRNLLRELLIFVAAWDLREEELYFKFMLQITSRILSAGLMPYAYHSFRDRSRSKDIISPAQAVLMKLLTVIFRQRGREKLARRAHAWQTQSRYLSPWQDVELKTDIRVVNFLFTEFRQHIIPQTCALIFLQGQIRRGKASPEDFPLNLWDMERMYEGVSQFLDFFEVLGTEGQLQGLLGSEMGRAARERGEGFDDLAFREAEAQALDAEGREQQDGGMEVFSWKMLLGEWEMVHELVTLLRELDEGIPKVVVQPPRFGRTQQQQELQGPLQPQNMSSSMPSGLMARSLDVGQRSRSVDDLELAGGLARRAELLDVSADLLEDEEVDSEGELIQLPQARHNSASASDSFPPALPPHLRGPPANAPPPPASPPPFHPPTELPPPQSHQQDQDEPSNFDWRDLKPTTLRLLSTLLHHNPPAQNQLLASGGLEILVRCCALDTLNPQARDLAILALRLGIEGFAEGRSEVGKLMNWADAGGRIWVPGVVLSQEAGSFVGLDGRVGFRKTRWEQMRDEQLQVQAEAEAELRAVDDEVEFGDGVNGDVDDFDDSPAARSLSAANAAAAAAAGLVATAKISPERAAELMQSALRELPLGVGQVLAGVGVASDRGAGAGAPGVGERERQEALRRLDRAFESTEVALGGGSGVQ